MNCICQRVYDTGFTGIPRIDKRLAHQYEVYGEDCIRRAFDHANHHIPYTDAPRRHYCFVSRTQTACEHESCDHARYRPPDTVRKMRWYIENTACEATIHYPDLADRDGVPELSTSGGVDYANAGETKYGTPIFLRRFRRLEVDGVNRRLTGLQGKYVPPSDRAIEERERWEDEMYRLHRNIGFVPREPKLKAIPIETFREELTTALTDISLDAGKITEEAFLATLAALQADTHDELRDDIIDAALDYDDDALENLLAIAY